MIMDGYKKSLEEGLDWLYSTQLFGIKLGLENSEKLLTEFLAYPKFETKVIQVAGTNGKGSTCAFMDSVARLQGVRTGLFTSPHLINFTERIRVSGAEISDYQLVPLLTEIRELVSDWDPHPTFFELTLAIAMRYFKDQECELVILEAGMGGRLDATTAVPKDLAVITSIGLDHQQYLGETIEEIAGEKAAIMSAGKPCVSASHAPKVNRVLEVEANQKRSELTFIKEPLGGYSLALTGEHQRYNAALALEALHQLGLPLSYDSVSEGLRRVDWKGRFQRIKSEEGNEVVLDCCHNVPAALELVASWKATFQEKRAHLVFGAAKDKNIKEVMAVLLPICTSVEVYEINNPRAENTESLASIVKDLAPELPCRPLSGLEEASHNTLTLVTGSLFLVGEWLSEEEDQRKSAQ